MAWRSPAKLATNLLAGGSLGSLGFWTSYQAARAEVAEREAQVSSYLPTQLEKFPHFNHYRLANHQCSSYPFKEGKTEVLQSSDIMIEMELELYHFNFEYYAPIVLCFLTMPWLYYGFWQVFNQFSFSH